MAVKTRRRKPESGGEDDWLTTYSDAVTLLLCFFIILFAMSEPKKQEFEKISETFSTTFSKKKTEQQSDPFTTLQEELEIMVEQNQLERDVAVEVTEKGIQLELSSSSFYHSGSAKFKKEAIPILEQVVNILADFNYDAYTIEVDGHTDDVPIQSAQYPSNWELSAGRAANVVRFFIASGLDPYLMKASGYAEVKPKVPNLDKDGNPIPSNRELNRRVTVRVERTEF